MRQLCLPSMTGFESLLKKNPRISAEIKRSRGGSSNCNRPSVNALNRNAYDLLYRPRSIRKRAIPHIDHIYRRS
jgi:hypothetical protein